MHILGLKHESVRAPLSAKACSLLYSDQLAVLVIMMPLNAGAFFHNEDHLAKGADHVYKNLRIHSITHMLGLKPR